MNSLLVPSRQSAPTKAATMAIVVSEIRTGLSHLRYGAALLVALDGASGAGKSSLARAIADRIGAIIIPSDDFFAAGLTDAEWAALDAPKRADAALDWKRLRAEALEPLLAGSPSAWHPFDFEAGLRPDGTYPMAARLETREPATILVLEGAYSSHPKLADLVNLSVLLAVSPLERHRRLDDRDEASFSATWHERWDAAEDYFFRVVRPPESFDLVVDC